LLLQLWLVPPRATAVPPPPRRAAVAPLLRRRRGHAPPPVAGALMPVPKLPPPYSPSPPRAITLAAAATIPLLPSHFRQAAVGLCRSAGPSRVTAPGHSPCAAAAVVVIRHRRHRAPLLCRRRHHSRATVALPRQQSPHCRCAGAVLPPRAAAGPSRPSADRRTARRQERTNRQGRGRN
jgi:hypothetical protein